MNRRLGFLRGIGIGVWLSCVHLLCLWAWNNILDPFLRRFFASDGIYGWDGERFHLFIDTLPFAIGYAVYYGGMASAFHFAVSRWPNEFDIHLAARVAFSISIVTSIAIGALYFTLAQFSRGISSLYFVFMGVATVAACGFGAFKGAQEVKHKYRDKIVNPTGI